MSASVFDLPLRRSLLLAIKETLNNAVKHSGATELCLQIKRQRHRLVVVVQDNGRGFDPLNVKPSRNGLSNMAHRLKELGGNFLITSEPGKGCRVVFTIPLEHPQRTLWARLWNTRLSTSADEDSNRRNDETSPDHDPTQR